MGCGLPYLKWLSDTGRLPRKGRLLDMGESCLLAAPEDQLRVLARRHGCDLPDAELDPVLEQFAVRSNLNRDSHLPTLFLSEFLELTEIEYIALDVVIARKGERFDLNTHTLASAHRETFDVVVNFGTTEHLMNQFNAFRVMHDAVRPGGYIYHQVPSIGYINHGYFCYTPLMFQDLARANNYDLLDLWLSWPFGPNCSVPQIHSSGTEYDKPESYRDCHRASPIPNHIINVLYRRTAGEFALGLEVRTAAGILDESSVYTSSYIEQQTSPLACRSKPNLFKQVLGKFRRSRVA